MARQFSIPTVLRMVPNELLAQFFARLNLGDFGIAWEELGEREIDPILKAIGELNRMQQDEIEGSLRSVFDLACDTGIDAIFEAAMKCGDLDLPMVMPQETGPYAKAMWAWLNRSDSFDKAVLIHQIDNLSWWRKRRDMPKKAADTSPEALRRLSHAMEGEIFENKTGALFGVNHLQPYFNTRLASFLLRVLSSGLEFNTGTVECLPIPSKEGAWEFANDLKARIVARNLAEHSFEPNQFFAPESKQVNDSGASWTSIRILSDAVISAEICSIEARNEEVAFSCFQLSCPDRQIVFDETGVPAGLLGRDTERVTESDEQDIVLKRAFEKGPRSNESDGDSDDATTDLEEDSQAKPVPPESFVELLSTTTGLHPDTVVSRLRLGILSNQWRCLPEERRLWEDRLSALSLLLLGFQWPAQIQGNEQVPKWAEASGIIPLTSFSKSELLFQRVHERLRTDGISPNDFAEVIGKPIDAWLSTEFFKYHAKRFKKRPIAWQVQSSGFTARSTPAFACLIYYHKLDIDLLQKVRKLAEDLRKSLDTELRGILSIAPDARSDRQEKRRVELEDAIAELHRIEAALESVATTGFGPDTIRPILRQYAINDSMLALKCRWLRRLNELVAKGPLNKWLQAASKTDLHPNFGSWIADALSHLDHFCARVGPQPPDQKELVDDPTAADLAKLIATEAETMFITSLRFACDVWWKPFHETVLQPFKEQVKDFKDEQKQCEARLKANPEPEPSVARELKARVKELKAEIKKLNAEIDKKTGLAQGVRDLIEAWRSTEPATWGDWLAEQPLFDQISSLDHHRAAPTTIAGFIAQESLYAPDINDGVRVNIAPLQKAGLLGADVLAAKDIPKAIADRAEWRSDERRWVREGKLPQPA